MNDQEKAHSPHPSADQRARPEATPPAHPAPKESDPAGKGTAPTSDHSDPMELYEEALKESDWGHQPC